MNKKIFPFFISFLVFIIFVLSFFLYRTQTKKETQINSVTPIDSLTKNSSPKKDSEDVILADEKVVYRTPEDYTRPEFCVRENRAYVTFRHSMKGKLKGRAVNEASLKVFDIVTNGDWVDKTKELFGEDWRILYEWDGDDGYMTDHQFVCDDDGFILAFESGFMENGEKRKHLAIHRFSNDFELQEKISVFENSGEIIDADYKADDPGLALLNGTLWAWVVSTPRGRLAEGFALYGFHPDTLEFTYYDGNKEPIFLKNPKQSPFSGVMSYDENEYSIFTSPKRPGGDAFDQKGLVEYRYDKNWNYIGMEEYEHSFGDDKPRYVTGVMELSEARLIGFLVQSAEIADEGSAGRPRVSPTEQYNNVGEAWIRKEESDGDIEYLSVSKNDGEGKTTDTRHTEFALWNDTLYVGYKYLTRPSTSVIKRFTIIMEKD